MENSNLIQKPLAVITGASSGIGYELAKVFARNGFDLFIIAENPEIYTVATSLQIIGTHVEAHQADLALFEDVESTWQKIKSLGRAVDCIAMNAGFGLCGEFAETDLETELRMVALNNISLIHLTKRVLPEMIRLGKGRILYTSSIAATMPGPYYAVYAATKAFIQSFSEALRLEVKDKGITVTALQPGPTDTNFFARAGMLDTKAGKAKKDDPAIVAQDGYDALMAGKDHVVAGSFKNKVQTKAANFMTYPLGAKIQGEQARPQNHG